MHSSKVELKTSSKHTMILTTKPPQDIINKEKKTLSLLCLV